MKVFYQVDKGGYKPTKAHDQDAGFDLYAPEDYKADRTIIDTKVHIMVPSGHVGLVLPRSSMTKNGFITHTGVIDAGYTGTIKIKLDYQGVDREVHYYAGQRIAQLVIVPIPEVELIEYDVASMHTARGAGAFGSSGK